MDAETDDARLAGLVPGPLRGVVRDVVEAHGAITVRLALFGLELEARWAADGTARIELRAPGGAPVVATGTPEQDGPAELVRLALASVGRAPLTRVYQRIAATVIGDVAARRRHPGKPLGVRAISRRFGVSHAPVGHALRLLERCGVAVPGGPHRPYVVSDGVATERPRDDAALKALREWITRGETPAGQSLPPVSELASVLGVLLPDVAVAADILVGEGVLVEYPGGSRAVAVSAAPGFEVRTVTGAALARIVGDAHARLVREVTVESPRCLLLRCVVPNVTVAAILNAAGTEIRLQRRPGDRPAWRHRSIAVPPDEPSTLDRPEMIVLVTSLVVDWLAKRSSLTRFAQLCSAHVPSVEEAAAALCVTEGYAKDLRRSLAELGFLVRDSHGVYQVAATMHTR